VVRTIQRCPEVIAPVDVMRSEESARRSRAWLAVAACGVGLLISVPSAVAQPALFAVTGSPFKTVAEAQSVSFSASGSLLAVGSQYDDASELYAVSGLGALRPIDNLSPSDSGDVAFSPTASLLATITDNHLAMLSVASNGSVVDAPGSPYKLMGYSPMVAFSPDGSLLVATSELYFVQVFHVGADGALTELPIAGTGYPSDVAFSSDGKLLAVSTSGAEVEIYSVGTDGSLTLLRSNNLTGGATSIAFRPGAAQLAVAGYNKYVSVLSVAADGSLTQAPGSPFPTTQAADGVAFNASGDELAVTTNPVLPTGSLALPGPGNVSVFSVAGDGSLTPLASWPLPAGASAMSPAFSPSGQLLAVVDYSNQHPSVSMFSTQPQPPIQTPAGKPRVQNATLTNPFARHPKLAFAFTIIAGSNAPPVVKIALSAPTGISFTSRPDRAVIVKDVTGRPLRATIRTHGQTLTVVMHPAAVAARLTITRSALRVSKRLADTYAQGAGHRVSLRVVVTDLTGKRTALRFSLFP
jgi:WD40 repeat protein